MGERGPKPKPTAQKELEGNPGKRALPENEAQPGKLMEIPKPRSMKNQYNLKDGTLEK